MPQDRDPFAAVGAAARSTLDAAVRAQPPLRQREWRVLAAVIQITATWSKLEEDISHGRLQDMSLIGDRRTLQRELRSLHNRGLVVYRPGESSPGGERVVSRIGLPRQAGGTDPRSMQTAGRNGHRPGGDPAPRPAGGTAPPPEKTNEKTSEERPDSQASRDAADEVARDLCRYFVTEHCKPNGHGVPGKGTNTFRKWIIEMAKLRRIGPPGVDQGVPDDRIREVIAGMARDKGKGNWTGWSVNCQSVPSFREKFTRIAAVVDRHRNGASQVKQVSNFTETGRVINP